MNNTTRLFNTTTITPLYINSSGILTKNMTNNTYNYSSFSHANKKYRSYICLTFFGIIYAYNYYISR